MFRSNNNQIKGYKSMTIQDIMNRVKAIKGDYQNNMITGDEMIEHLEDLVHDVEGNDGFSFGGDDEHYASFEETDFTTLEVH
jgi:hypothetical protein|tara:strand:- start:419 stop:664 length:246 start_codon:yes stop_codon:yes gene_type:complete